MSPRAGVTGKLPDVGAVFWKTVLMTTEPSSLSHVELLAAIAVRLYTH